ncbi:MAG: hypothetical protein EP319_13485 [Deltaproteobacteria bacterium]|nr:MAG: hypothetical protein EP319_13485 [Deltaproteobacteria bacterium]
MKKLLIIAALFAGAASASVTGDKILFQKDSTFVSAAFSKTLCLNEEAAQYEAMVTKCIEWTNDDDRNCLEYTKVFATQPQVSTRQRCAQFGGGDDDRCMKWETVPFVQNRVRTVKWYRDNDGGDSTPYKVTTVVIPSCK